MSHRTPLLRVEGLSTGYGNTKIVSDVSIEVGEHECVGIFGPNGHGKTTFLRAITGELPIWSGNARFADLDVRRSRPFELARAGLVQVPQGGLLFGELTVRENLLAALQSRDRWRERHSLVSSVLDGFPLLRERSNQLASSLSGGEQRMLALARALVMDMRMLVLDEPTLGLAPRIVEVLYQRLRGLSAEGMTILVVEENPERLEGLADRLYLFDAGHVVREGTFASVMRDRQLLQTYLGMEATMATPEG